MLRTLTVLAMLVATLIGCFIEDVVPAEPIRVPLASDVEPPCASPTADCERVARD
jgi:hypothetical protein